MSETNANRTARMPNPAMLLPEVLAPMQALGQSLEGPGMPSREIALAQLRASQINGCSLCLDLHVRAMRRAGETVERLLAVATWRESSAFTPSERAALGLAEAMTRFADAPDPVSDPVWAETARYFEPRALAGLVVAIAAINMFNRINVTTHQLAADWDRSKEVSAESGPTEWTEGPTRPRVGSQA